MRLVNTCCSLSRRHYLETISPVESEFRSWFLRTLVALWLASSGLLHHPLHAESTDSVRETVIELTGDTATITGPPLANVNGCLEQWHSKETGATWNLSVGRPSVVEVELVAAVQRPFDGSELELWAGQECLQGELTATGGWHRFHTFHLGSIRLHAGEVQIRLQPTDLPRGVFGNVKAVRIRGIHLKVQTPPEPTDLAGPVQVYSTARFDGTRLSRRDSLRFHSFKSDGGTIVAVDPNRRYQSIEGFGGAFTEATAYVFDQLSPTKKQQFLAAYFDANQGNGYRLCRTHINSCDFSLGSYAYDEVEGDTELTHFTIEHDRKWLIPLIKAAQATAGDEPLKILASPWSPPAWMKTNGKMTGGGKLKPEYREAWARYFCRYIEEYRKEGIEIWGVTVQNEPLATQRWESCLFTAEEERDFVRDYLGPVLHKGEFPNTRIVVWDHNRDLLFHFAQTIYDDPQAAKFVWGAGFHWYVADDFANVQMVHDFYPDKKLLFTEGCVEGGAHRGDWSVGEKYAKSVINDLNHWAVGWIDWNLMLDVDGGPNHVQNFCSAPITGDVDADRLIYNNSYYYLGHFSRFIRPGASRVLCQTTGDQLMSTAFVNPDGVVAVVVLNLNDHAVPYSLAVKETGVEDMCPPHSIKTLVFHIDATAPSVAQATK
jgi:glucosylceramidase